MVVGYSVDHPFHVVFVFLEGGSETRKERRGGRAQVLVQYFSSCSDENKKKNETTARAAHNGIVSLNHSETGTRYSDQGGGYTRRV